MGGATRGGCPWRVGWDESILSKMVWVLELNLLYDYRRNTPIFNGTLAKSFPTSWPPASLKRKWITHP